jgi:hypothetical protein
MRTKEVAAALDDSAHRAAHLGAEVSEDVSCHVSPLEGLGAVLPCACANGTRSFRTNDSVSSQVSRHRTGRSLNKQSTGNSL